MLSRGGLLGGFFIAAITATCIYNMKPWRSPSAQWLSSFTQASAEAKSEQRPILVVFQAGWCAPCRHYERTTLEDPSIEKSLKDVVALKLDIDAPANKEIVKKYQVVGLPTTLLLNPNGQVISGKPGDLEVSSLARLMRF